MWIIESIGKENSNLPIFYKKFSVDKKIKKCVLKISALGVFSIKINGKEIADYFMPGWTNYNHYVHLCDYDLTKYIKKVNLLEVTLADGWYSGKLGYTRKTKVYGETNALFAELILSYQNGEEEKIETDESWKVGESNIVSSSFFDGERVDFTAPKITDLEELPFAKKYDYNANFKPYTYEPVRKIAEIVPKVIYQDKSTIRLDFQQNFAGFIRFIVQGDKGTEISIRHAEVLNEDATLYTENLRQAKATDSMILSGGVDKFDPKFTFHGFRYAEITVQGNAKILKVKGIALSQNINYHGKFSCSDELVNQIFGNVVWGQLGNFISIPTDCPQRDERLGWTGDAQVFCNSAMFNADCKAFFANYLRLICADILPDGKIPSLVPFFIPVSASTAGVPGWADAICVIPYTHYLHYRDKNILRENLPFAVKHLEYYLSNCDGYLSKVENPFGDWLCVKTADDKNAISQCFLGLSALLISKMYHILEENENAQKYAQIYEKAKVAFRDNYRQADGKLQGDSQTIYALALSVGFVCVAEIKQHFINSIERADWKLTTGFIGVKYLLPALCEIGETDIAYKIIKETEYPSWGYTIKQGATTIWERWNGYTKENGFETPNMNSFNHYSLGSCVEWLYSYVLGIKLSEDKNICISPAFSKELSFAKGEYKTYNGKIQVNWHCCDDNTYHLQVKADKNVVYDYDFSAYEVVALKKRGNALRVVLK